MMQMMTMKTMKNTKIFLIATPKLYGKTIIPVLYRQRIGVNKEESELTNQVKNLILMQW